jgi:NAD(P)-dependent dehydrogenase (short-subunit alcohol dehydrogenase family)
MGEAIAREFVRRGLGGLVICGRNEKNGNAVAADLTAQGCPTLYVRADLASAEEAIHVVAEADKAFGKVHILVNAVRVPERTPAFVLEYHGDFSCNAPHTSYSESQ